MTTATDLSGRELDEAIARAMGWEGEPWEWHQSLDMALYDLWPELVRRGWQAFVMGRSQYGGDYWARLQKEKAKTYMDGEGPTLPLAFARAVLAALLEGGE